MLEKEMFRAVKVGDEEKVKELLAQEPKLVGALDAERSTPLHWAAWKGQAAIVELLLDAGADIQAHNANGHWGTTPLHAAAHANQRAAAVALIARGADVNAARAIGIGTPLAETKVHSALAVARLLRDAGAVE